MGRRPSGRARLFLAVGLLLAGALLPGAAGAGSLRVSPLHLNLIPGQPAVVLTVENEGETGTLVQVEAFSWTDADVTEGLPPTDDLLAAPPVFDLPPGGKQLVRLGLRRAPTDGAERAYRLVIGEVPAAFATAGGGITFALRFSVPVFVTPPGAEPAPIWSALAFSGARGEVRLANAGRAHLLLRDLKVVDPATGRLLLAVPRPRPVLAGGERRWAFDAGSSPLPRRLEITVVSNAGDLHAVVPVEGG